MRRRPTVGLDADDVRRRLASDQDVAQIENEAQAAKEAGIEGVPMFIFGGKFAVSGAQAPEYLAEAIARVAQGAAPRNNSRMIPKSGSGFRQDHGNKIARQ